MNPIWLICFRWVGWNHQLDKVCVAYQDFPHIHIPPKVQNPKILSPEGVEIVGRHHLWHYVGTLHWMMAAMNDMELIHSITRCWQRFTKKLIEFQMHIIQLFIVFSKLAGFLLFHRSYIPRCHCFLPSDGCFHITQPWRSWRPGRGATLLQEGSQPHQARGPETWGNNGWMILQGSIKWNPFWVYQTMQIYGRFEGFPL